MLFKPFWKILFSLGLSLALLFSLLPILTVFGASLTFYDGALGTTPDVQGYFNYQSFYPAFPPEAVSATQTPVADGTILDSTPVITDFAGYFGQSTVMPVLDRTYGYTITFVVQVITETHAGSDKNSDGTDDRAGFSVIVLSSDLEGIELGFWMDQIWAQADTPLFTHAEGVTLTTTSLVTYDLAVLSNTYTLSANSLTILTGSLRNYTAFNDLLDPYETPNFLFLGDDTRSAKAKIKLTHVSITTNPIPPSSVALSGPTGGVVNTTYSFTANTSPVSATTPLTYTWQATDQAPVIHSNSHSDTVNFSWSISGSKTITVTVNNGATSVTSTHTINLTVADETFLPVILKSD